MKYLIKKHGITQSLITTFLKCRQKMKYVLEGYTSVYNSPSIHYGEVVHEVLEIVYTKMKNKSGKVPSRKFIIKTVRKVCRKLKKEYGDGINDEFYQVMELNRCLAEAQMPLYFQHYKSDFRKRKWVALEKEFCVPIKLPCGVTIPFRGKMDGLYSDKGLRLLETKTKSYIDVTALLKQLVFDFQIISYFYAAVKMGLGKPVGCLYNVIRRPGLRQKKSESFPTFIKRVEQTIKADPKYYFIRLNMTYTKDQYEKFDEQFKTIVNDLYLWWNKKLAHYKNTSACQDRYGSCTYLGACANGDFMGLKKRDKVFPELGGKANE